MAVEIELKYRVQPDQDLFDRLEAIGAVFGSPIEQVDLYLAHPIRDFRETGEAFRIRDDGSKSYLTYKGTKRDGLTKTREEIEVVLAERDDSLESIQTILDRLGFSVVARVAKRRREAHLIWANHHLTLTYDQLDGVGTFLEVETIAQVESAVESAQHAVKELAEHLGLFDVEGRSYLRLSLEHMGTQPDQLGE